MKKSIGPDRRIGRSHNRALCCTCGTLRLVSNKYRPRGRVNEDGPPERMTMPLKCATCGTTTKHAFLRDCAEEKYRDTAERGDHKVSLLTSEAAQRAKLLEYVDSLRQFGVLVEWVAAEVDEQGWLAVGAEQTFFDRAWTFTLNENAPSYIILGMLKDLWTWISDPDQCEAHDWHETKNSRYCEWNLYARHIDAFAWLECGDIGRLVERCEVALEELS